MTATILPFTPRQEKPMPQIGTLLAVAAGFIAANVLLKMTGLK